MLVSLLLRAHVCVTYEHRDRDYGTGNSGPRASEAYHSTATTQQDTITYPRGGPAYTGRNTQEGLPCKQEPALRDHRAGEGRCAVCGMGVKAGDHEVAFAVCF